MRQNLKKIIAKIFTITALALFFTPVISNASPIHLECNLTGKYSDNTPFTDRSLVTINSGFIQTSNSSILQAKASVKLKKGVYLSTLTSKKKNSKGKKYTEKVLFQIDKVTGNALAEKKFSNTAANELGFKASGICQATLSSET